MWDPIESKKEVAVLVALDTPYQQVSAEESLLELQQLARTAGASVKAKLTQRRKHPHPAYHIGTGKMEELKEYVLANKINLVLVDDELSPTQESNLEEELGCKVIDRTRLILDIFAIHAHSSVGKLQVELAQMEYYLPRLKNIWHEFSKLGGGIGTRFGPGEKKIEIDKRIISDRIALIKKKLERISVQRKDRRKQRRKSNKKNICLVGYTNSGKSTLLNKLTGANVVTADKLFATLSPTTRQFNCGRHQVLLTDTVGFIRKLPHKLVEAFMATLEQVQEADLLLHVIDISSENYRHQIDSVNSVLGELHARDIPVIKVYNKIDQADIDLSGNPGNKDTVYVSAIDGSGIDELTAKLSDWVDLSLSEIRLRIPQTRQDIITSIYKNTDVTDRNYEGNDIILMCRMTSDLSLKYQEYEIS